MSSRLGLPLWFSLTAARLFADGAGPSPASETMKAAIKQAYPYDPKIRERALAAEAAKAEGVIQMEKVVVIESQSDRRAPEVIDQARLQEIAKDFNLLEGGRIISGPRAELGLWKYVDPLGATPSFSGHPSAPKIDILHLKF